MFRSPLSAFLGFSFATILLASPGCGGSPPPPALGQAATPPAKSVYPGDPAAADNPAAKDAKLPDQLKK